MKRITYKLLNKINQEAENLVSIVHREHIVRLVGPNYIYFTNGDLLKVFFESTKSMTFNKYAGGILFPIKTYIELKLLNNILKDLKVLQTTL